MLRRGGCRQLDLARHLIQELMPSPQIHPCTPGIQPRGVNTHPVWPPTSFLQDAGSAQWTPARYSFVKLLRQLQPCLCVHSKATKSSPPDGCNLLEVIMVWDFSLRISLNLCPRAANHFTHLRNQEIGLHLSARAIRHSKHYPSIMVYAQGLCSKNHLASTQQSQSIKWV